MKEIHEIKNVDKIENESNDLKVTLEDINNMDKLEDEIEEIHEIKNIDKFKNDKKRYDLEVTLEDINNMDKLEDEIEEIHEIKNVDKIKNDKKSDDLEVTLEDIDNMDDIEIDNSKPFLYVIENLDNVDIDEDLKPVFEIVLKELQTYFEKNDLLKVKDYTKFFDEYLLNSEKKIKIRKSLPEENFSLNHYNKERKEIVFINGIPSAQTFCHEFIHFLVHTASIEEKTNNDIGDSFLDEGFTEFLAEDIFKKTNNSASGYINEVKIAEYIKLMSPNSYEYFLEGKNLNKCHLKNEKLEYGLYLYHSLKHRYDFVKEFNKNVKNFPSTKEIDEKYKELCIEVQRDVIKNNYRPISNIQEYIEYAEKLLEAPFEDREFIIKILESKEENLLNNIISSSESKKYNQEFSEKLKELRKNIIKYKDCEHRYKNISQINSTSKDKNGNQIIVSTIYKYEDKKVDIKQEKENFEQSQTNYNKIISDSKDFFENVPNYLKNKQMKNSDKNNKVSNREDDEEYAIAMELLEGNSDDLKFFNFSNDKVNKNLTNMGYKIDDINTFKTESGDSYILATGIDNNGKEFFKFFNCAGNELNNGDVDVSTASRKEIYIFDNLENTDVENPLKQFAIGDEDFMIGKDENGKITVNKFCSKIDGKNMTVRMPVVSYNEINLLNMYKQMGIKEQDLLKAFETIKNSKNPIKINDKENTMEEI